MTEHLRLVGPVERALYLRTIPAMQSLEPTDLAVLAAHARERHFRRGQTILRRGERVEHVYVVFEGSVRIEAAAGDVRQLGPRSAFGVLSLLARSEDGIQATAMADTLTLEVDADTLIDIYDDHFSVLLSQIRNLAVEVLRERRRLVPGTRLQPWNDPPEVQRGVPVGLVERLLLLRRALHFHRTGVETLAELARLLEEVRIPAGQRIWRAGEASGYLLLVLAGSVACFAPSDGAAFHCGPGYPLGNLESMAREPRWYDATAETEVVALRGEAEGFLDVLEDHFEMAMDFVAAMSANLLDLRRAPSPGG